MKVKILAEGGAMKPGPALSQKLGPAGINISQVIQQVNEATKDFKGLKVPVELDIDAGTKQFSVNVSSPPTSELLKKEAGAEKGSGRQKKIYSGNISIEQVISVAKQKMPDMLAKDFRSSVKNVVGTCSALGLLIENKDAVDVAQEIEEGKYDEAIKEERTETPEEKKKEIDSYFSKIKVEQDKILQAEKQKEEKAKK